MVLFYLFLLTICSPLSLYALTDEQRAEITKAVTTKDAAGIYDASKKFTQEANAFSHGFKYDPLNAIGLAILASSLNNDYDLHAHALLRDDASCQTFPARVQMKQYQQKNDRDRQKDALFIAGLYAQDLHSKKNLLNLLVYGIDNNISPDIPRATAMIVAMDFMNAKPHTMDKYKALLYGGKFTLGDDNIFNTNPAAATAFFDQTLKDEPLDIFTEVNYRKFLAKISNRQKEMRTIAVRRYAQPIFKS